MNVRREKLVTLIVLASLTLAFVAAVALPGRQARAELRREILDAETVIARGPAALELLRTKRAALESHREQLRSSAAMAAEPHNVLHSISRFAKQSGFSVVRIEPLAVRPQATYVEHPYQIDFRAKLGALAEFLRHLESSDRLFMVEEIDLRNQAAQQGSETLEGKIWFSAYAFTDGFETPGDKNDSNVSR